MSVVLDNIKNFWVEKITALLAHKGVDVANLIEGVDWEDKLKNKGTWDEIKDYAVVICQDIYDKAVVNLGVFPVGGINPLLGQLVADANGQTANNEYWRNVWRTLNGFQERYLNLMEAVRDKIGVDPDSGVPATGTNGNNILVNGVAVPLWKYEINQKIPNGIKLTDIPANLNLLRLLYRSELYEEIIDPAGLNDLLEYGVIQPDGTRAFIGNSHGYNFTYKVDTTKLQEYKDIKNKFTTTGNQIGVILGLAPTDFIPNDWNTKLAKKSDLDTATAQRDGYKTKSDGYDRIHTKLSGKVSDSELDTLLNSTPPPQCSHTDYDTIKTERDQLKTENTELKEHKCDCDSKVQAKESEIITKIITDLGLATERERENVLEAVITEIKTKITPPTDNNKDSKITELETKITNLQTPKSLSDLPISSEVKKEVIKISQELGLTAQSCAKLESAKSYQELSTLQKKAFQEKLNSEISERKNANYLNYGLGALTIGSLLILAYLLIKRTNFDLPGVEGGENKK